MTAILYNEIDPHAAGWLRALSAAGRIAPGRVDDRSIADLGPDDLRGVRQFHAFAGIGLWSVALRMAGVPDAASVWTGSAPCQPFSTAGSKKGTDDDRHLAPAFLDLVRIGRPQFVFGEQVARPLGRAWFDAIFSCLESMGYAVGAAILPASGVGAPHARERIFFGAVVFGGPPVVRHGGRPRTESGPLPQGLGGGSNATSSGGDPGRAELSPTGSSPVGGAWAVCDWLDFHDRGRRPTQPGIHPLAHWGPRRLATFRALGNAIVPQIAAEFVAAFVESASDCGWV